jgi:hypothetical protein
MKGISRIESEKCVGWFVRAYRDGKTFSKLFSDRKCGGKGKALALAKQYRETLEAQLPPANRVGRDGPSYYTKVMRHNKTGVNGVFKSHNTSSTSGKKYEFFGVHYKEAGKSKIKKIYLHHHRSEKSALREAAKLRKAMEEKMMREWRSRSAKRAGRSK